MKFDNFTWPGEDVWRREQEFCRLHLARFYADAYAHPAYAMRNKGVKDKRFRQFMRYEVRDCARRFAHSIVGKPEEPFLGEYSKADLKRIASALSKMTFDELRRAAAGERADAWMLRKGE